MRSYVRLSSAYVALRVVPAHARELLREVPASLGLGSRILDVALDRLEHRALHGIKRRSASERRRPPVDGASTAEFLRHSQVASRRPSVQRVDVFLALRL